GLVLGELPDQLAGGVVPLAQDRVLQALPELLGGLDGRAGGGEQAEGASSRSLDELGDLVEVGGVQAVPSRRRQVPGDVEDPAARVVERRPDVEGAPPGPLPL